MRTTWRSLALVSVLLASCSSPAPNEGEETISPPSLTSELRIGEERRLEVEVSNTDPQSAACFPRPPADGVMWGDNPSAYFQVVDRTGRSVEPAGEVIDGTPALRTQVVFIRPGTSLTSTINIEEHFPGALAPGSCIAFQIPIYANCRALERWDITAPMRPDADQQGAGNSRSDWRVSDTGELSRLPDGQHCSTPSQ